MQEAEIIEKIRSGSTKEIKYLYSEETKRMIINYITNNSGSQDDGVEMHQLAVIKLYEKCQSFDFVLTSKISTYLFSIAKNLWLKKLRDTKEYASDDFSRFSLIDDNLSDLKNERIQLISNKINELGAACKKLLVSFYYGKRSIKEIRENLGYNSDNAVKASKSRCMKQLKESILN